MSNINQYTNIAKYINDVKWVRYRLMTGIEGALVDINKKLVFGVDDSKNIEFPANVSINGDPETYNLTKLFENVQYLNQQLGNIENLSEIQEIMNNLNSIERSIQKLENNTNGFERDGYESKTNINDKIEFKNDIVLASDKPSNGSIIGYGGIFGLDSSVRIKCVHDENVAYWEPPNNDHNDYDQLFMIELLRGKVNSDSLEYDMNLTLDYKAFDGMTNVYEMNLVSNEGRCVSNSLGTTLTLKIDVSSNFIRGTFEKDGVVYNQKAYVYSDDSTITFHTDKIVYNSSTGFIGVSPNPTFTIESGTLNILNQNEEGGTSELIFIPGTSLNAYVDQSGPTAEQKDNFIKQYHISDSNIWNNVVNNGVNISNYPTNEAASITFNDGLKLMSNVVSDPIVEIDDSELNVKLANNNVQKDVMNLTTEGLKTNSLILNKTNGMDTDPQIKVANEKFDFNNDAQFTFDKSGESKTVSISELSDNTQKIRELENRIITLERATWFINSSMVDNSIFSQDALSDEDVRDRFNNEDNPVYHVDEQN